MSIEPIENPAEPRDQLHVDRTVKSQAKEASFEIRSLLECFCPRLEVDVELHPHAGRDAVAPDVVLEPLTLGVGNVELDIIVMTALTLHKAIVRSLPSNHRTSAQSTHHSPLAKAYMQKYLRSVCLWSLSKVHASAAETPRSRAFPFRGGILNTPEALSQSVHMCGALPVSHGLKA